MFFLTNVSMTLQPHHEHGVRSKDVSSHLRKAHRELVGLDKTPL